MLQLLGRNNSSNVQTVLIALAEMGIDFERHDFGGPFGKTKTDDYLRRNPNGLVPTLVDGELDVWETNTILRYLAHKYGPTPLYPDDPAKRSHVERWMDWRQTCFNFAIGPVFMGYVRTKPEDRDRHLIRAHEQKTITYAQLLDTHLSGKTFIANEVFSFADATLAMFVHRYFVLPFETPRPATPDLQAWVERMRARPSIATYTAMVLT